MNTKYLMLLALVLLTTAGCSKITDAHGNKCYKVNSNQTLEAYRDAKDIVRVHYVTTCG